MRAFGTRAAGSAAVALGLSMLVAGPAGAAPSDVVKPTADQKAAVVKAWSKADGGTRYTGPLKCLQVRLAASNRNVAGLKYNGENRSGCRKYAFDGAALLYGNKGKQWYLLAEGSGLPQSQCKALAKLMGNEQWNDLVGFGETLGCENFAS